MNPTRLFNLLKKPSKVETTEFDILSTEEKLEWVSGLFLSSQRSSVRCMAIYDNLHYAITSSNEEVLRIWDLNLITQKIAKLPLIQFPARCISHSEYDEIVLLGINRGHNANDIFLRNFREKRSRRILKDYGAKIICIQSTPDLSFIAAGCDDGSLLYCLPINNKFTWNNIKVHSGLISSICISYEKKSFVIGSSDSTLSIYSFPSVTCLNVLSGHTDSISCVAFVKDSIYSGSRDGCIRKWSMQSLNEESLVLVHFDDPICCMCVTKDNSRVVCCGVDSEIRVVWADSGAWFRLNNGREIKGITCMGLFGDDMFLLLCPWRRNLVVWDLERNCLVSAFDGHNGKIERIEFFPTSNRIVSVSRDGCVKIWDTKESVETFSVDGFRNKISFIGIDESFTYLVTVEQFYSCNKHIVDGDNSRMWLWDTKEKKYIRRITMIGCVWSLVLTNKYIVCFNCSDMIFVYKVNPVQE